VQTWHFCFNHCDKINIEAYNGIAFEFNTSV